MVLYTNYTGRIINDFKKKSKAIEKIEKLGGNIQFNKLPDEVEKFKINFINKKKIIPKNNIKFIL